jgi:cytoskeletal protein CcmA (bactofilin family)
VKRKIDTSGDLSGFLDVGSEFHGELSFQDTLRIDGKFKGAIKSGRLLVIGESADVDAEIHVETLSVSGTLRGSVRATGRIELHDTARCQCSLDTNVLVVEEGAVFEGHCSMKTGSGAGLAAVDNLKQFAAPE